MKQLIVILIVSLLSACGSDVVSVDTTCQARLNDSLSLTNETLATASRAVSIAEHYDAEAGKWRDRYCNTTEGQRSEDCVND